VLAVSMTKLDVICVARGVRSVETEELVPVVRDRNKLRINGCAKVRNEVRQRIVEVSVFATSEAMAFHHHAAAEKVIRLI
jgi:hypothetical protein